MIEALGLCLGIAAALTGYLLYPRTLKPVSQDDLPRYRRLSEEARRFEIHPFE